MSVFLSRLLEGSPAGLQQESVSLFSEAGLGLATSVSHYYPKRTAIANRIAISVDFRSPLGV
jgi:hypothetical protein